MYAFPDTTSFHFVNAVLHGLVSVLVLLVCERFAPKADALWIGVVASLLFAVHPVHTEAVSNLTGRADVLATFLAPASKVAASFLICTKDCL